MSDIDSAGEGTSGGTVKKRKYIQNYKEAWENEEIFKGWLTFSKKGRQFACCKCCNQEINIKSGKDSLLKHYNSKNHIKSAKSIKTQKPIDTFFKSNTTLDKDIKTGKCMFSFNAYRLLLINFQLKFVWLDLLLNTICPSC